MTGGSSQPTPGATVTLQALPPSAKLIAKALEYEGDLTQQQLAEWTLLPERTVRSAVTELQENELVTEQISFMDARKRIYSLDTEDSGT